MRRLLRSIADQLGMDVAFIAELSNVKIIQWVEGGAPPFHAGQRMPLEETYCYRMVRGDIPSLICDAVNDPRVRELAVTTWAKIGAYAGVPIVLPSGQTYGSLCVLSQSPRLDLDERTVASLRAYADLVGHYLGTVSADVTAEADLRQRVAEVMARGEVTAVFQPIVELVTGQTIGFEALARFPPPDPSPFRWFADAERAGLRPRLELSAASAALGQMMQLPPEAFLSLNFSPAVLSELDRLDLASLSERVPLARVVVEVTEEAPVADYVAFSNLLEGIRAHGARLAIDDAGAGYASMLHIVRLHPEFIKLDIAFVRGIDQDPARRALATSLNDFAARTGARVIAEGIETSADLGVLTEIGIPLGQGYLLGAPARL